MSRWLLIPLLCVFGASVGYGVPIERLLPALTSPLCIEPFLPNDFVMGSFTDEPDLFRGVAWGRSEDLDCFLYDPTTPPDQVSFFLQMSGDMVQDEPLHFHDEESLPERLMAMGNRKIEVKKNLIGDHPFLVVQYENPEGREVYLAWVGLNAKVGGWSLLISFHYPENEKRPKEEELTIWRDFLAKTTPWEGP